MASRATQGGVAAADGGTGDTGSESVFSVTLRIVVLSALLLLALNAVFAAGRLRAPAAPDASNLPLRLAAERLAARAGDISRTLRVSAEAGAQRLQQR
ncbi:MAG: hypothetical protein WA840_12955, partial [Caulobacteraceae bacterium]